MVYNNQQISGLWRDSLTKKEEALRSRYAKSLENLSEHTRPLTSLN